MCVCVCVCLYLQDDSKGYVNMLGGSRTSHLQHQIKKSCPIQNCFLVTAFHTFRTHESRWSCVGALTSQKTNPSLCLLASSVSPLVSLIACCVRCRRWQGIRMYNTPVCISSTVFITETHWLLRDNTNFVIWNEGNLTDVYLKEIIAV
jgi:hypothetical protein